MSDVNGMSGIKPHHARTRYSGDNDRPAWKFERYVVGRVFSIAFAFDGEHLVIAFAGASP